MDKQLERYIRQLSFEGIVTDVNAATIDMLLKDIDLVIDATDNIETRFLINEACTAHRIPWIYGGVLGSTWMTMNILPEDDAPCFACFTQSDGGGTTCAEAGVLNTITVTIAALQCTEAFKILTGCGTVSRGLRVIDLWQNIDEMVPVTKNPECPVCAGHTYRFYKAKREV